MTLASSRGWRVSSTLRVLRIGQSVLQAYHGIITRMDTQALFMPTILLGCPLIALALYAAARNLGLERRYGAIAGLFGGLVPGVALLVQESFLSQVLAIPLLLLLPTLLSIFNRRRSPGELVAAVLCIGALASIYTEFLVLALLIVGGFLVLALAQRPCGWRHCLGLALVLAAPWFCNPLYMQMTSFLTSSLMTRPGVLKHIYPWAYDTVSFGVVWFGDFCVKPKGPSRKWYPFVVLVGQIVVAFGMTGLVALATTTVLRWWRGGRQIAAGGFDLALALLALGLIPVVMLLRDTDHHYQFFKILITVSPLYALGTVALAVLVGRRLTSVNVTRPLAKRAAVFAAWLPVLFGAGVAGTGTAALAYQSADPKLWFRSQQHVALGEQFRSLRLRLEDMQDEALLIRPLNFYLGYQQNWSVYWARFNKVWLAWPFLNDQRHADANSKFAHFTNLDGLPKSFMVLTPRHGFFLQPPRTVPPHEIYWQNGEYILWKYDGEPWGCITNVDNPNGCNEPDYRTLYLGGGATVVHLHATEPGWAQLTLAVTPGPCLEDKAEVRLEVEVNKGRPCPLAESDKTLNFTAYLQRGHNTITIKVLNTKQRSADGDPRPLLAKLLLKDFDFRPDSQQPGGGGSPVGN